MKKVTIKLTLSIFIEKKKAKIIDTDLDHQNK